MKLIILRGAAGVGKTTVSDLLAKALHARCYHLADTLRALNIRYVPGYGKWIPLEKFLSAHAALRPQIREELKTKDVIVEGNFYHENAIIDFTQEFESIVLTLDAPLKDCIHRDSTRGEKYIGPERIAQVYALTHAFSAGISINTENMTAQDVVAEIIKKLKIKE